MAFPLHSFAFLLAHKRKRVASHQCVGNFSLTDWMMSFSTFWSVCVTKSMDELFTITASFCAAPTASRTTLTNHNSKHLTRLPPFMHRVHAYLSSFSCQSDGVVHGALPNVRHPMWAASKVHNTQECSLNCTFMYNNCKWLKNSSKIQIHWCDHQLQ